MTRIGLRKAWFQVHKWIGLLLAIMIIPLSLTGAALVWDEPLERLLSPARYATSGAALLAPAVYANVARKAVSGAPLASLKLPVHSGDPVIAQTASQQSAIRGPAPRTNIYLDPPTARVLEVSSSRSGPVMAMHLIHGSLMIPGVGRAIVGWIGVAMLFSSISGLWLWWPTMGSWLHGLRWRRHRHVDANLHHLFGFWIALPLFVLSLTSAWISFPGFFGSLVGENGRAMGFSAERAALNRAKPLPVTRLSLEDAAARLPVGARIAQIAWPNDYKSQWRFTLAGKDAPVVVIDDASGRTLATPPADRGSAAIAQLMRRIHDGNGMGIVWQVIIFLGGLLAAMLAITGVIMWARARTWRRTLKERRAAA